MRETLFHELFHLNDEEHHDWSQKTLASDAGAGSPHVTGPSDARSPDRTGAARWITLDA